MKTINRQMSHLQYNEWVLNDKISRLAVAHEAIFNALRAAAILIALGDDSRGN